LHKKKTTVLLIIIEKLSKIKQIINKFLNHLQKLQAQKPKMYTLAVLDGCVWFYLARPPALLPPMESCPGRQQQKANGE
jgi:hypothetical protein